MSDIPIKMMEGGGVLPQINTKPSQNWAFTCKHKVSTGLQGGGYTWSAIADSLIRLKAPEMVEQVEYNPEAGMMIVQSNNLLDCVKIAGFINEALENRALLDKAIDNADPTLLE